MDKFPLLWEGRLAGNLTVERDALYTRFTVRCRLPGPGLWCAWAVGEDCELRLGVLEPEGETSGICRRYSDRMTAPLGRLLRGELRPAGEKKALWEPLKQPEQVFHTPWLRRQLQGVSGALTRQAGERRYLAVPYEPGEPFPLTPLFCFAACRRIAGADYLVFCFGQEEWPCFG